ncbi:VCBS repeat-containing protein [bacterium]|nr:VCBS repeat-containing protein [bacterium]
MLAITLLISRTVWAVVLDTPTQVGPEYNGEFIQVADVDGDGDEDMIASSRVLGYEMFGSAVAIYKNNGAGVFGDRELYETETLIICLLAADIDKDGAIDIVGGSITAPLLWLMKGNGDGTFNAPVPIDLLPFGGNPRAIAADDIDHDGDVDLAICSADNGVYVLLNEGVDTFAIGFVVPLEIDGVYSGVVTSRLNDDDYPDLIVSNGADHSMRVFLSDSSGSPTLSATLPIVLGISAYSPPVLDANDDGRPDIVAGYNPPMLFLGNGDGTFQDGIVLSGNMRFLDLAVADMNEDGREDIVASAGIYGTAVFLANNEGFFNPPAYYARYGIDGPIFVPKRVNVADMDGDGHLDVTEDGIVVLYGRGDGSLSSYPLSVEIGDHEEGVQLADMDRDGHLDLIATDEDANTLSISEGLGNGFFGAPKVQAWEGDLHAMADLNNDGWQDLFATQASTNNLFIQLGTGPGTFGPATVVREHTAPEDHFVTDMDGDGNLDLVPLDFHNIIILPGNGDGTFGAPIKSPDIFLDPLFAFKAADLNNDGYKDIVVTALQAMRTILNSSDGAMTLTTPVYTPDTFQDFVLGDFNEDTFPDMAGIARLGDVMSVFIGNGDGTFSERVDYTTYGGPTSIVSEDFDGDGHIDLAAMAGRNRLDLFLGNGDGTFQIPVSCVTLRGEGKLLAGDFDEDGDIDLLSESNIREDVVVIFNRTIRPEYNQPLVGLMAR